MNREIIFRAWDKEEEKFVYAEPVYGFFPSIVPGSDDTRYGDVQEYSGTKDKNGKEIYEGDIVNFGDDFPSVVVWDILAAGETPGFWLKETGDYKHHRFYTMTAFTNPIEIIGNIVENPELLDAN